MPTLPLPEEPNWEHLRHEARDLQRAVRLGEPAALAEVDVVTPSSFVGARRHDTFQLSAAQVIVARRYGFASWTRLKRHVEIVRRYSRFPDRQPIVEPSGLAEQFLRLACLTYGNTDPTQFTDARALLSNHPEIGHDDIYVAAAVGDQSTLRALLAADPSAARREGGPHQWEPLLYLAYARHDPAIEEGAVLGAARLLLEAGADPNAGYLWHGLPSPFTALTGAFGEGEQGTDVEPRHPHSLALARLLLEAGADPNDAQALYNRMFRGDNDHLELLLEFGLGTGNGGRWRQGLGDVLPAPTKLLRDQLAWAIAHGMIERVRLLANHSVDVITPLEATAWFGATTPVELAASTGHPELVDYLVGRGAPRPHLQASEAFVAAVLAVERAAVAELMGRYPDLPDTVRDQRTGLMAWAAVQGGSGAVELLVDLGFDVNALGRTDVPSNQPWHTALHGAVEAGSAELAQTLLRLGADPNIRDQRFDDTPLGWARHFGHQPLIELLEPVTAAESRSGDPSS